MTSLYSQALSPLQGPGTFETLLEILTEAMRPYEFRTFVIGFHRPNDYDRTRHETAYRDWKVALGEALTARFQATAADFLRPDLRVDVSPCLTVRVTPAPLFIAGRYRKLSREIPSARWVHHACRGRGCASCSFTGNLCGPSIEELVSEPVLQLSGGERTHFHALGREDTDARMLGRGRPFVLEVHRPVRRALSLDVVRERFAARADGVAELMALAPATHADRSMVKAAAAEKAYRAWIEVAGLLPPQTPDLVQALAGTVIDQQSPVRVEHRRGRGRHRLRKVIESAWIGDVDGRLVWETRVESGMYVKELVSGDGGRTRPSLSEVLGLPCTCAALDVLDVHWDPPWESPSRTEGRPRV